MPVSILSELSLAAWSILAALAFVSVIATTIALAKLVQFARRRVGRRQEPDQALRLWLAGDHAAALATAQGHQGSRMQVLRVLLEALARHPEDRARAQAQATLTAMEELAGLSRHLRAIEAVVQAAPMLGLLGTVIGMIEAFARLAQTTGGADPALLAGGIWTALVTTALGLAIAILFHFVWIWLETRVSREREALESLLARVLSAPEQPHPLHG